MNDLETTKMQTPIEIALGVDENGMTTARALYEFWNLRKASFQGGRKPTLSRMNFMKKTKTGGGSTLCRTVIIARIIALRLILRNICLWNPILQKGRLLDSILLP